MLRHARYLSTKPYEVFDRQIKLLQRTNAAQNPASAQVEYLRDEVARKTIERLAFVKRTFPRVLDYGCGSGNLEKALCEDTEDANVVRERLGEITMTDSSEVMLHRWSDEEYNNKLKVKKLVVDEETMEHHELHKRPFDAVISNMALHWVNDLPGVLKKINSVLKPDGLFMASMISEDSLFELRRSLQLAESERRGGMSPRVSPLVTVNDISSLLKQNKFNLVTIDVEEIIVGYPDLFAILQDLQLMGENNANKAHTGALPRDVLTAAQAIYRTFHGDPDGTLPLTYRVLFMVGWKHAEHQPKPLDRGTGEFSLKDVLK